MGQRVKKHSGRKPTGVAATARDSSLSVSILRSNEYLLFSPHPSQAKQLSGGKSLFCKMNCDPLQPKALFQIELAQRKVCIPRLCPCPGPQNRQPRFLFRLPTLLSPPTRACERNLLGSGNILSVTDQQSDEGKKLGIHLRKKKKSLHLKKKIS